MPPRVEAFCWLIFSGKVSMNEMLKRRGFLFESISELCLIYGKEGETIDHLFLHHEYSSIVELVFRQEWCGLVIFEQFGWFVGSLEVVSFFWERVDSLETHSICYFVVYLEGEEC